MTRGRPCFVAVMTARIYADELLSMTIRQNKTVTVRYQHKQHWHNQDHYGLKVMTFVMKHNVSVQRNHRTEVIFIQTSSFCINAE